MQKLFGRSVRTLSSATKISKTWPAVLQSLSGCTDFVRHHYTSPSLTRIPLYRFSNENGSSGNGDDSKDPYVDTPKHKPNSIPLKPYKATLDESEEKANAQTYVLFTSSNPIVPFTKQSGVIKTGNLAADHMQHEILYILQEAKGDIYTIGVVLKNEVTKKLRDEISSEGKKGGGVSEAGPIYSENDPSSSKTVISTRNKNFRVKLTEIEYKDNCIFAKGIPYKDKKMSQADKKVNFETEVTVIKNLCHSVRYILQVEYIEAFNSINFESYFADTSDFEKLEELLYNVVGEIGKVNNFMKENYQEFFQLFLEQQSLLVRVFMVKKKLEELHKVLDIASKGMKAAEDSIRKTHEIAKARLSIEYIKNNYLGGLQQPQGQGGIGAGSPFGMSNQNAGASKAKAFMDKLSLIPDEVSREKIRKEIERFGSMDRYSNEYQKIYTYLDEVFSIPWDKRSDEFWDLQHSKEILENELYGLEKVKERIVELIAVNKLRRSQDSYKKKGFVLCLYGPPGTGKTSIAKAISKSLKRESRFISFAGVSDSHFMKGHRRTYVDSQPGVFIRELIKAKTMNPVLVLDEIDKIGRSM